MINTNTVLSSIAFSQTIDWNIKQFFNSTSIKSSFELKRIGKALTRRKDQMVVEDDKKYKRITIKTNCGGVFVRDEVLGKDIKTKNQYYVKAGQLAVSKIDARNGAFGIVPPEADGAIITGNFWVYDVNPEIININYLVLLLSSNTLTRIWLDCSNGSGNRLYLQEDKFLSYKIPMPNISIQNKMINKYHKLISEASNIEETASKILTDIEIYIMDKLNLHYIESYDNSTSLRIVSYKNLNDKWEWNALSDSIERSMKDCIYPVKKLGQAVSFVNRSWKPKKTLSDRFMYIEIGGVNAIENSAVANEVLVSDAPSRATQFVKKGDLIIGTTRPYLKRFALISEFQEGYVCSSGFQVIESSQKYDLRFIIEVLKLNPVVKQFESFMTGALYPAINFEQLRQVRIPIPPIEMQRNMADYICQKKTESYKLQIKANDLKTSAKKEVEEVIFCE